MTDPVREALRARGETPSLDAIRRLFPPTAGDAAFDPVIIRGNIERLATTPEVNTGHPFIDLAVKTGLAFIDATFQGDHPKYGVKHYAENRHDGFPPTIVAAVDALSAWGLHARAAQLFRYWLAVFVRPDGTIAYYGPALSEYGQILHTAVLLHERIGGGAWWDQARQSLPPLADYLSTLCAQAEAKGDLIAGIPEADISTADPNNVSDASHSENNRYFHNNVWVARGLKRWSELAERTHTAPGCTSTGTMRRQADSLVARTRAAIEATWPRDLTDWWLPPQLEPCPRPRSLTDGLLASYTNYRYWPELLSSGELPDTLANRIVDARLTGGGQFCGMTRFNGHLDDWPLADYLYGLWRLGRKEDFLLSLYGHVCYHQASGHLTAYEQVTLPPGREMMAPYCLPSQLVATRAARLLAPHPAAPLSFHPF
jgi:hypothetical protein